jgi:ParG
MKTIPFKPAPGPDPVTRTVGNVISWPMKRITIDVPIDLHIRLKTGCAMRGEKIADVIRTLIEREFPPRP